MFSLRILRSISRKPPCLSRRVGLGEEGDEGGRPGGRRREREEGEEQE